MISISMICGQPRFWYTPKKHACYWSFILLIVNLQFSTNSIIVLKRSIHTWLPEALVINSRTNLRMKLTDMITCAHHIFTNDFISIILIWRNFTNSELKPSIFILQQKFTSKATYVCPRHFEKKLSNGD